MLHWGDRWEYLFGLSWMLASNPGFPFPNFGEKCETKL